MNLPQDCIRGGDAEIPQKIEMCKTTKEKFTYVARKTLNISWPHCLTYKHYVHTYDFWNHEFFQRDSRPQ